MPSRAPRISRKRETLGLVLSQGSLLQSNSFADDGVPRTTSPRGGGAGPKAAGPESTPCVKPFCLAYSKETHRKLQRESAVDCPPTLFTFSVLRHFRGPCLAS